jgi:chromosome segregation ATPase
MLILSCFHSIWHSDLFSLLLCWFQIAACDGRERIAELEKCRQQVGWEKQKLMRCESALQKEQLESKRSTRILLSRQSTIFNTTRELTQQVSELSRALAVLKKHTEKEEHHVLKWLVRLRTRGDKLEADLSMAIRDKTTIQAEKKEADNVISKLRAQIGKNEEQIAESEEEVHKLEEQLVLLLMDKPDGKKFFSF